MIGRDYYIPVGSYVGTRETGLNGCRKSRCVTPQGKRKKEITVYCTQQSHLAPFRNPVNTASLGPLSVHFNYTGSQLMAHTLTHRERWGGGDRSHGQADTQTEKDR